MTVTEERATFGRSQRLWSALPRELAERFRPHTELLAKAVVYEIQCTIPEYARPLDGSFGECFTRAVDKAIRHAVDATCDRPSSARECAQLFHELGRCEFEQGREPDCLQAAYRVGGRVAWRYLAEFGQANGVPAPVMCACADAIFAYVDEMSTWSVAGYEAARASAAGRLGRRRRRLLEQLLAEPPASPGSLAKLAAAAKWPLPERVTAVALEPGTALAADAPGEPLVALEGPMPCLLTALPEDRLGRLDAALAGGAAAVGPTVRLADAAQSLRWARRTMALVRQGAIPRARVVRSADHLSTLWLSTDRFLLDQLGRRALAPFEGLTPARRTRLSETLLAWLQCPGGAPELATRLGVHPQTVRYRLRQLTELFGDRLNDPEERLNLEITLRAEQLPECLPLT